MKTIQIVVILFAFTILNSCNWFFSQEECKQIKEIVDYKVNFLHKNPSDNGGATLISSDNYTIKYYELIVGIDVLLLQTGVTENCSYMEDSIIGNIETLDIYSNTDFDFNFPKNTNLNKLFFTYPDSILLFDNLEYNKSIIRTSLTLHYPPTQADTFIFDIHIVLNDSRTFDIESKPIIITP